MNSEAPYIVTLCTGNAARSVMAAFMLEHWSHELGVPLEIASAGTHVVEGQPMSMRTRTALGSIPELRDVPVAGHRSRQLSHEQIVHADLIVAMEADHVRFVRRHHPEAAGRCATIRRLDAGLSTEGLPLAARIDRLGLADLPLDPTEDVADPAGGDVEVYVACAHELWWLTERLARLL